MVSPLPRSATLAPSPPPGLAKGRGSSVPLPPGLAPVADRPSSSCAVDNATPKASRADLPVVQNRTR
eukprot:453524-Amphidinium_carterae.1